MSKDALIYHVIMDLLEKARTEFEYPVIFGRWLLYAAEKIFSRANISISREEVRLTLKKLLSTEFFNQLMADETFQPGELMETFKCVDINTLINEVENETLPEKLPIVIQPTDTLEIVTDDTFVDFLPDNWEQEITEKIKEKESEGEMTSENWAAIDKQAYAIYEEVIYHKDFKKKLDGMISKALDILTEEEAIIVKDLAEQLGLTIDKKAHRLALVVVYNELKPHIFVEKTKREELAKDEAKAK